MERKVIPISNYREITATDFRQLIQRLRFFSGPLNGTTVEINEDIIVLGRSPQANLRFEDGWTSDLHCMLIRDEYCIQIVDLNSGCGTYVNGRKVNRQRLQTQDRIRLG